ncbi:hypothetical protein LCGC14_1928420 [marine sediment metagenome]|uniref:Mechanosensitive ion channel MscS domain-containing protein n=1 Tax=marine sediment metagenome TaxID=412755 RepID=A0A0F9ILI6_9ZZZZ
MESKLVIQLALSAGAVLSGMALSLIFRKAVRASGDLKGIGAARQKVLQRGLKYLTSVMVVIVLTLIWGIDFASLWVISASLIGFMGVALFATWSFISNIFAAFVLFFSSPYGMGDRVSFKDNGILHEGVIDEMTLFYVYIRDSESSRVCIPNSAILQKAVRILDSAGGEQS